MILQNLLLDLVQGCPDGIDLRQEVNAVTVVFYHPEQAANLALDALEPRGHGFAG
jgi:hypothetical protein